VKIIGIDQDGAFADFVKIPAANIIKLDSGIPEHYGAILDPLAMRCIRYLPARCWQSVLVTGCGPIGLMSIVVAKACGSSMVFATETNEHRRAMAKKMGADVVINPATEDAREKNLGRDKRNRRGRVARNEAAIPPRFNKDLRRCEQAAGASLLGIPTETCRLILVNDVIFKGREPVQGIYGRRMYDTWSR